VKKLLMLAVALVAGLGVVSSASARSRDRNHDRLPDRWERAHHLSLKVKQGKRDQDRDGLNNRGEFRAKTNPRDADTDNDGIRDGKEHAGTVKSFESGVLTISLAQGGELVGIVDDRTEIECESEAAAHASSDGRRDDSGSSGNSGPSGSSCRGSGDDRGDHDAGDDHGDDPADHDAGDDDRERCGTDALTAGTRVREADVRVTSTGRLFSEIELA
jgi:hypothetical protein